MEISLTIIFFFVGACIGSFINVLVDRLPKDKSIVGPPSHCDSCKRRLTALELVPVFSYLVLRGRADQERKCLSGCCGWNWPGFAGGLFGKLTGLGDVFILSYRYRLIDLNYILSKVFSRPGDRPYNRSHPAWTAQLPTAWQVAGNGHRYRSWRHWGGAWGLVMWSWLR
jgi:hypothetical protein